MFEMAVLSKRHMQVSHAEREVLRQVIDGAGVDGCALESAVSIRKSGIGRSEGL